ncbi:MAG: hypothetical protein KJZ76_17470 [Burkholderiaceae bacterium]|nr:hypothetical protein [Burkholderiaceae bacterium]
MKHCTDPLLLIESIAGLPQTGNGTFHHLIALFCTVAGKAAFATGFATTSCNEIKDLGAVLHVHVRQKTFYTKQLDAPMKVTPEACGQSAFLQHSKDRGRPLPQGNGRPAPKRHLERIRDLTK